MCERRALRRDERPDPNHVRLKFLKESQVRDKVVERLERGTDHEAGADLIADVFQVPETSLAIFEAH